jgi:hypothetical protein
MNAFAFFPCFCFQLKEISSAISFPCYFTVPVAENMQRNAICNTQYDQTRFL